MVRADSSRLNSEDAADASEENEGGGTRTLDQRIKSPLLYRLSYALKCVEQITSIRQNPP